MNAKQCKMARAALGLSAQALADASGVHYATIARFEGGSTIAEDSRAKMMGTLMSAGAEFSYRAKRVGVTVPE